MTDHIKPKDRLIEIVEALLFLKKTRIVELSEEEVWTLAHALADIEKSSNIITSESIPQLLSPTVPPPERMQAVIDICEELRHIAYHIDDSKFLKNLVEG